jgi:soluble lytic murein transglycosylase-like protein
MADTPGDEYASLGDRQQRAYQLLAAHSDWVPAVLNAVSLSARSAIQDNLAAAQQIDSLNGARSSLPHWQIIAPPAPEVLLGYYREAQQAYGIQWQYLAAINLIETNMGRIRGLSSAGAQGPMQFMPATWASYGHGDVNNPHDAIQAAGRYLKAHGAPQNMSRAIYAYTPATSMCAPSSSTPSRCSPTTAPFSGTTAGRCTCRPPEARCCWPRASPARPAADQLAR